MFQSTHLREVRPSFCSKRTFPGIVSIHAPTRGATITTKLSFRRLKSFNPRTYERCDVAMDCRESALVFQSTHLREVRHGSRLAFRGSLVVSIHAPTRGATIFAAVPLRQTFVSIHAPTRGATPLPYPVGQGRHRFQSTHLREVRHSGHQRRIGESGFNPRTYERCDRDCRATPIPLDVSIHAPTRGATNMQPLFRYRGSCFNPRTYERCDKRIFKR